ncbi:DoxX family membrane protein [Chelativorans sp. ZYF759]|uniref:DoxX family protein n=1 Tax=Chelativorans sp. ZYF759 TaxID=2692213 RepID=UPI00145D544B|nr:DoxX family protein [Chelativorans sp. ZYF759]NMG37695.1 DoxX family membrane protein [Chelativorans sp. ZYF759]
MTTTNSATLLVARIFLAILFIVSGLGILAAPSGFAGYMGAIGLPFPTLVAWVIIALKVLGGLAILVGFQTRYAAYAIAAFTIGSAFLGHMDFSDQMEMTAFMKNFAIAGGFLALSVAGPGAWSIDARRREPALAHA